MKETFIGVFAIVHFIKHDIIIDNVSFQNINVQRFEHSENNVIILSSLQKTNQCDRTLLFFNLKI